MTATLRITFSLHIAETEITSMVYGLGGYGNGNVLPGRSDRDFVVRISRMSKLPQLKHERTQWEIYGFVRWSAEETRSA